MSSTHESPTSTYVPAIPPQYGLRMKRRGLMTSSDSTDVYCHRLYESSRTNQSRDNDDVMDCIRVLVQQDSKYTCRDYIGRRSERQRVTDQIVAHVGNDSTSTDPKNYDDKSHHDGGDSKYRSTMVDQQETSLTTGSSSENSSLLAADGVDVVCREKMCDWSYRVADHFRTDRETVAYSFSFLDRFVDHCCTDRTAYKLAAMTTLYLATKMFNNKIISIASLAELSRGEFDIHHIAEVRDQSF
jgi:hypothetical protein